MKERDEELALFLEMRRREKENEKNNFLLLRNSDELDGSRLEFDRGLSVFSKIVSSVPPWKMGAEEILSSENEKSDYDWLLTPPGTPLFPTLEKEPQISVKSEMEIPKARPTALKPRIANIQEEPASRKNVASKHHSVMPGNRRPSSARSTTPSGRPKLPSTAKSSRPSTPTSRTTLTSSKPTAPPVRSSTPTRSSLAASKTTQRSATLTSTPIVSVPIIRSSSTSKIRLKTSRQSRGPERPASTSRSRPGGGAPSCRTSSLEANNSSGKSKRSSWTLSKGRALTEASFSNPNSEQALRRSCLIDGGDSDSPVVVGTKMVERIVNMRKLAPPKHDGDQHSALNNSSGKSSLFDSLGFGRTLSKKSLDMAMRHMDIRRSMTSISASFMYKVRSAGSSKSRTVSSSDSPLATSSTASSEPSVNNNSLCCDGSETEENDSYRSSQ